MLPIFCFRSIYGYKLTEKGTVTTRNNQPFRPPVAQLMLSSDAQLIGKVVAHAASGLTSYFTYNMVARSQLPNTSTRIGRAIAPKLNIHDFWLGLVEELKVSDRTFFGKSCPMVGVSYPQYKHQAERCCFFGMGAG